MFVGAATLGLAAGGLGAGACTLGDAEASETTLIRGVILDAEGVALAGVRVEAKGGGTHSNADGTFEIEAENRESAVLIFRAQGYVRGLERIDVGTASEVRVDVSMIPMAGPLPLDSTLGGEVVGARQAALVAGPEAFRDRAGNPVTGMVDVHLTPLNPLVEAELDAYPGDGLARDASGELLHLETFGVLDVTVMQGDEELNIREGMGVTIRIPLPDPLPLDPPESIALWGFDDAAGVWVEEGIATLDAEQGVYEGTIGHLSPWNADKPLESTCIRGRALNSSGDPAPNVLVIARGVDYVGASTTVSEDDGGFCVPVRKDSEVRVKLVGPTNARGSKLVESGSADTEIPPVCSDSRCLEIGDVSLSAPDPGGWPGGGGGPGAGGGATSGGGAIAACMWGAAPYLEMELSGAVEGTHRWGAEAGEGPCLVLYSLSGEEFVSIIFPTSSGDSGLVVGFAAALVPGETGDEIPATLSIRRANNAVDGWFSTEDSCTIDVTRHEQIGSESYQLEGRGRCIEPVPFLGEGESEESIVVDGEFEFSAVRVGLGQFDEDFVTCCILNGRQ